MRKNKNGIPVKRICASCEFKTEDNVHRFCTKGHGIVLKDDICDKWLMSHKLENVGASNGGIKRKEYLDYVVKIMEEEERKELYAKGLNKVYTKKTLKEIRQEYYLAHGSIYLINP